MQTTKAKTNLHIRWGYSAYFGFEESVVYNVIDILALSKSL